MQDADVPISYLPIIRIVSRLFAAFLLFWAGIYATNLPTEILNLAHDTHDTALAGSSWSAVASYSSQYMMLGISVTVFRIALCLIAAGWFYRCGPRIQRFFTAEAGDPQSTPSNGL